VTCRGNIEPQFLIKPHPPLIKLPIKKNNIHINKKPPQPHKIKAQKTKKLQQLVVLQKLVYKSPNLPHQTEK
jgi:hypothetical protein